MGLGVRWSSHEVFPAPQEPGGCPSLPAAGLRPPTAMNIWVGVGVLVAGVLAYGLSYDARRWLDDRRWQHDQQRCATVLRRISVDPVPAGLMADILGAREEAMELARRKARELTRLYEEQQAEMEEQVLAWIRRLPTYVSGDWEQMR